MQVACFDTSTINQLLLDPEKDRLTATLLDRYDIYITAVNVAEIGKTSSPEKREQLRSFEKRLAKNFEPLDMPHDIVRKVTGALGRGEFMVDFQVTDERRGLWVAMSEPNSVGETERDELYKWAAELESSHRRAAERFRARITGIFTESTESKPSSPAQALRFYLKATWPILYALPSQVFKHETGRVLPLSRLDALLGSQPSVWPLFLGAYAFLFYAGSLWDASHGPRNTTGLLDAWNSVYLPFCDVFVTHDRGKRGHDGKWRTKGQYDALRVVNTLNSRKPRTKIYTWEQFRAILAG